MLVLPSGLFLLFCYNDPIRAHFPLKGLQHYRQGYGFL